MTAEETELTFTRCPNCRTLIPAVARRCKMCGAQFDKKTDEEQTPQNPAEDLAQSAPSRIRQKTLSVSADEVSQIKSQISAPPVVAESIEQPFRLAGTEASTHHVASTDARKDSSVILSELGGIGSGFKSESEDIKQVDVREKTYTQDTHIVSRENFDHTNSWLETDSDIVDEIEEHFSDEEAVEEDTFSHNDQSGSGNWQQVPGETRKRKRRRRKKKTGMSGQVIPEATHTQQPASVHQNAIRDIPKMPVQLAAREAEAGASQELSEPKNTSQKMREVLAHTLNVGPRVEGALIGWLVSFDGNSLGEASEIRSGRFFMGSQKLRPADVVIEDSTVSTPHCMATASETEGLFVQDLMSEGGTFIKRLGSEQFERVTNVTSVFHGDCLRLGHFELLVCLVPVRK